MYDGVWLAAAVVPGADEPVELLAEGGQRLPRRGLRLAIGHQGACGRPGGLAGAGCARPAAPACLAGLPLAQQQRDPFRFEQPGQAEELLFLR